LTTTGDLSAYKSQTNFDTTINRQHIVVKSKKTGDLVLDLTKVFMKLRQHGV
jgi:hypothetical protein